MYRGRVNPLGSPEGSRVCRLVIDAYPTTQHVNAKRQVTTDNDTRREGTAG